MRRTLFGRAWMVAGLFGLIMVFLSNLASASPVPIHFLEMGAPTGMESVDFPTPVDVNLSPASDFRAIAAGPVVDGFGIGLSFCAILNENPGAGCQTAQPAGSTGFSLFVDLTLLSEPDDVTEPSLIFFSTLFEAPTYSLDQVSMIWDAEPAPGFDPTPFTTARYPAGDPGHYYYLGFWLTEGDSVSFQVDVAGDHSAADQLLPLGATAVVIPEPSTALLLVSGLMLLTGCRTR